jgi:hypothetical protein
VLAASAVDSTLARIARGATALGSGYGPLVPDPRRILDLPAGFQYRLFSSSTRSVTSSSAEFQQRAHEQGPVPCATTAWVRSPVPTASDPGAQSRGEPRAHRRRRRSRACDPRPKAGRRPRSGWIATGTWCGRSRASQARSAIARAASPRGAPRLELKKALLPGRPGETNADLHPG